MVRAKRWWAAVVTVGAVAGAGMGLAVPSSAASATADPAAGASYLVSQLSDGTHLNYPGGAGANDGGTADLALALASTGTQDAALVKVVSYLREHVADYADPDGKGDYPGPYSGSAAKLALLAEVTGQNPASFGGFDLISTLTGHVCAAADTAGACTAKGDFYQAYSGVSQALGVLALERDRVTPPAAAVARLEQLQCPDGGFSSTLITGAQDCSSDIDTTGYAVQALALAPGAADAVDRAVQFLLDAQQTDGGWIGTAGENSNSTALATQALLAASGQTQPTTTTPTATATPSGTATASTTPTATATATPTATATATATPSATATATQSGTATTTSESAAGHQPDSGFVRSLGHDAVGVLAAAPAVSAATAVTSAQAWLAGLQNADGGFGISTASPADDTEATAQAVPAVAGATFTTLRHPITLAAGSSGGSATNGNGSSVGRAAVDTSAGSSPLADTGADVTPWIELAVLLLVAGVGVLAAGNRRVATRLAHPAGRHRTQG